MSDYVNTLPSDEEAPVFITLTLFLLHMFLIKVLLYSSILVEIFMTYNIDPCNHAKHFTHGCNH